MMFGMQDSQHPSIKIYERRRFTCCQRCACLASQHPHPPNPETGASAVEGPWFLWEYERSAPLFLKGEHTDEERVDGKSGIRIH